MPDDVKKKIAEIYDQLNKEGAFKDGAGQKLGHQIRAGGYVEDPTQGGSVTPKPPATPAKQNNALQVKPAPPIAPAKPARPLTQREKINPRDKGLYDSRQKLIRKNQDEILDSITNFDNHSEMNVQEMIDFAAKDPQYALLSGENKSRLIGKVNESRARYTRKLAEQHNKDVKAFEASHPKGIDLNPAHLWSQGMDLLGRGIGALNPLPHLGEAVMNQQQKVGAPSSYSKGSPAMEELHSQNSRSIPDRFKSVSPNLIKQTFPSEMAQLHNVVGGKKGVLAGAAETAIDFAGDPGNIALGGALGGVAKAISKIPKLAKYAPYVMKAVSAKFAIDGGMQTKEALQKFKDSGMTDTNELGKALANLGVTAIAGKHALGKVPKAPVETVAPSAKPTLRQIAASKKQLALPPAPENMAKHKPVQGDGDIVTPAPEKPNVAKKPPYVSRRHTTAYGSPPEVKPPVLPRKSSNVLTPKPEAPKVVKAEQPAKKVEAPQKVKKTQPVAEQPAKKIERPVKTEATPPVAPKVVTSPEVKSEAPKQEAKTTYRNVTEPSPEHVGKSGVTYTPTGKEVPFRYRVVPMADLLTSHTSLFGKTPGYAEALQPRDRSSAAMQAQVHKIGGAVNHDLIGESPTTADGAPIVGRDLQVESGNGRSMGVRLNYENGDKSGHKDFLVKNADKFGLKPESIAGIKDPIIVRESQLDHKTVEDRKKFAEEAGESTVTQMSPTEMAKKDADRLHSSGAFGYYNPSYSLTSVENHNFVTKYLEGVPDTERNTLLQDKGILNTTGVTRIKNAMLRSAFDDTIAVRRVVDDPSPDVKNVGNAMMSHAPEFSKLKNMIAKGEAHPLDITEDISNAANRYSELKRKGMSVDNELKQTNIFNSDEELSDVGKLLLRSYDTHARAPKRLMEVFDSYTRAVKELGAPNQSTSGIVADKAIPTKEELTQSAIEFVRRKYGNDLFTETTPVEAKTTAPTGDGKVGNKVDRAVPQQAEQKTVIPPTVAKAEAPKPVAPIVTPKPVSAKPAPEGVANIGQYLKKTYPENAKVTFQKDGKPVEGTVVDAWHENGKVNVRYQYTDAKGVTQQGSHTEPAPKFAAKPVVAKAIGNKEYNGENTLLKRYFEGKKDDGSVLLQKREDRSGYEIYGTDAKKASEATGLPVGYLHEGDTRIPTVSIPFHVAEKWISVLEQKGIKTKKLGMPPPVRVTPEFVVKKDSLQVIRQVQKGIADTPDMPDRSVNHRPPLWVTKRVDKGIKALDDAGIDTQSIKTALDRYNKIKFDNQDNTADRTLSKKNEKIQAWQAVRNAFADIGVADKSTETVPAAKAEAVAETTIPNQTGQDGLNKLLTPEEAKAKIESWGLDGKAKSEMERFHGRDSNIGVIHEIAQAVAHDLGHSKITEHHIHEAAQYEAEGGLEGWLTARVRAMALFEETAFTTDDDIRQATGALNYNNAMGGRKVSKDISDKINKLLSEGNNRTVPLILDKPTIGQPKKTKTIVSANVIQENIRNAYPLGKEMTLTIGGKLVKVSVTDSQFINGMVDIRYSFADENGKTKYGVFTKELPDSLRTGKPTPVAPVEKPATTFTSDFLASKVSMELAKVNPELRQRFIKSKGAPVDLTAKEANQLADLVKQHGSVTPAEKKLIAEFATKAAPVTNTHTDHTKTVRDSHAALSALQKRNAGVAKKHLEKLESLGVETEPVRDALDEYENVMRDDFETGQDGSAEYNDARREAWSEMLSAFSDLDGKVEHPHLPDALPEQQPLTALEKQALAKEKARKQRGVVAGGATPPNPHLKSAQAKQKANDASAFNSFPLTQSLTRFAKNIFGGERPVSPASTIGRDTSAQRTAQDRAHQIESAIYGDKPVLRDTNKQVHERFTAYESSSTEGHLWAHYAVPKVQAEFKGNKALSEPFGTMLIADRMLQARDAIDKANADIDAQTAAAKTAINDRIAAKKIAKANLDFKEHFKLTREQQALGNSIAKMKAEKTENETAKLKIALGRAADPLTAKLVSKSGKIIPTAVTEKMVQDYFSHPDVKAAVEAYKTHIEPKLNDSYEATGGMKSSKGKHSGVYFPAEALDASGEPVNRATGVGSGRGLMKAIPEGSRNIHDRAFTGSGKDYSNDFHGVVENNLRYGNNLKNDIKMKDSMVTHGLAVEASNDKATEAQLIAAGKLKFEDGRPMVNVNGQFELASKQKWGTAYTNALFARKLRAYKERKATGTLAEGEKAPVNEEEANYYVANRIWDEIKPAFDKESQTEFDKKQDLFTQGVMKAFLLGAQDVTAHSAALGSRTGSAMASRKIPVVNDGKMTPRNSQLRQSARAMFSTAQSVGNYLRWYPTKMLPESVRSKAQAHIDKMFPDNGTPDRTVTKKTASGQTTITIKGTPGWKRTKQKFGIYDRATREKAMTMAASSGVLPHSFGKQRTPVAKLDAVNASTNAPYSIKERAGNAFARKAEVVTGMGHNVLYGEEGLLSDAITSIYNEFDSMGAFRHKQGESLFKEVLRDTFNTHGAADQAGLKRSIQNSKLPGKDFVGTFFQTGIKNRSAARQTGLLGRTTGRIAKALLYVGAFKALDDKHRYPWEVAGASYGQIPTGLHDKDGQQIYVDMTVFDRTGTYDMWSVNSLMKSRASGADAGHAVQNFATDSLNHASPPLMSGLASSVASQLIGQAPYAVWNKDLSRPEALSITPKGERFLAPAKLLRAAETISPFARMFEDSASEHNPIQDEKMHAGQKAIRLLGYPGIKRAPNSGAIIGATKAQERARDTGGQKRRKLSEDEKASRAEIRRENRD